MGCPIVLFVSRSPLSLFDNGVPSWWRFDDDVNEIRCLLGGRHAFLYGRMYPSDRSCTQPRLYPPVGALQISASQKVIGPPLNIPNPGTSNPITSSSTRMDISSCPILASQRACIRLRKENTISDSLNRRKPGIRHATAYR